MKVGFIGLGHMGGPMSRNVLAAGHDLTVGGADLAGQAIRAGLVDEVQLFLVPVIVGAGQRALPGDARSDLELLDLRRFASGSVYLRYRLRPGRP